MWFYLLFLSIILTGCALNAERLIIPMPDGMALHAVDIENDEALGSSLATRVVQDCGIKPGHTASRYDDLENCAYLPVDTAAESGTAEKAIAGASSAVPLSLGLGLGLAHSGDTIKGSSQTNDQTNIGVKNQEISTQNNR